MNCGIATSCGSCLQAQWDLPSNLIVSNFTKYCEWCIETNTCVNLSNVTSCSGSGSGMINFDNQTCPELKCSLNAISGSPYICSASGIVLFLTTLFVCLALLVTAWKWFKLFGVMVIKRKSNFMDAGEYPRCIDCGDMSPVNYECCDDCTKKGTYKFSTIGLFVLACMGVWNITTVPTTSVVLMYFVWLAILVICSLVNYFIYKRSAKMWPGFGGQNGLVDSLTSIRSGQLRYSIAHACLEEPQQVLYAYENTKLDHIDVVVKRIHVAIIFLMAMPMIILPATVGWNEISKALLPISFIVITIGFCYLLWPLKKCYACVVTPKKLIYAKIIAGHVNTTTLNFATEIDEITVEKSISGDYGQLTFSSMPKENIPKLEEISSLEAALRRAGFDGELSSDKPKDISMSRFAMGIVVVAIIVITVGNIIAMSFQFNVISLWSVIVSWVVFSLPVVVFRDRMRQISQTNIYVYKLTNRV